MRGIIGGTGVFVDIGKEAPVDVIWLDLNVDGRAWGAA